MTTFEFVSVLMSIVVGLGITRILSGLAWLVEHRVKVKLDGITLVWAINVLGFHLIYWWVVVNNWRPREDWTFLGFAALFLYGVALFFCAALILPRPTSGNLDLKTRFESIRAPFFLLWLLVLLCEGLDSLLKGIDYVLADLGTPYLVLMISFVLLTVAATRITSRRFHWAFAFVVFAANTAWLLFRFSEI